MDKILILGMGNKFFGDDGVGIIVSDPGNLRGGHTCEYEDLLTGGNSCQPPIHYALKRKLSCNRKK